MKIRLINRGKTISVKNNEALVTWLRKNDSQKFQNNQDFMLAYARRKELYDNKRLRHENSDYFVEDLINNGYVEIL